MLAAELDRLRADPPLQGLPVIELRRGAGAYICGEESAMLESIEGKRGLPRLRPPYVAERGLFGRPTLVHNFETLYWVREIVERGPTWFASQGRRGRHGLRSFSVSGRVAQPGVKLAPAGITLRELVDEHCGGMLPGHELYAYLPGGASGGILPARLADVPLDFDTLQPHGPHGGCFIGSAAVIVLSQHDRAVDAARNVMRFFEHESCGQCTPCRAGTAKASALMAQPAWDLPLLAELSQVMRDASICGLGQAAPNVVDGVLRPLCRRAQRDERRDPRRTRPAPAGRRAHVGLHAGRPAGPGARRRDDHRGRATRRRRDPAPVLDAGPGPGRQLPRLRRRGAGRARAGRIVLPAARRRAWRFAPTATARAPSQRLVLELLQSDLPEARAHARQRGRRLGGQARRRSAALRRARADRGRSLAPGHRGEPGRLHPVHALRARLPRRAGQRRHRPGLPRRAGAASCSTSTTRWALDLRGLRRMRAGLPDRARWRRRSGAALSVGRPAGRHAVPVLRRRLPGHAARQGRPHPACRRPRRPGQPRPAVRQGPLRPRLRAPPAAPDGAADPPRRRTQARRRRGRPGDGDAVLPRGELGRGAGAWPAARCGACATTHGPRALAGFGSAKGSNEEAYLFQKLVRLGFGSNNVDHCTRLCHASSVAALLEGLGSGAVSNPVMDVTQAEVVLVIGANPTVNHPVAATWIKNAVRAARSSSSSTRAAASWRATPSTTCRSSPTATWRC